MAEGYTLQIEIKGVAEFGRLLDRLSDAVRGQVVQDALLAGAYIVEGYAKTGVPVDTGFLRSSIQTARGPENSAIVAVAAEYAPYVEYGTARMGAQPYMRPAVDQHIPEITQAVSENLSDGIAKALR